MLDFICVSACPTCILLTFSTCSSQLPEGGTYLKYYEQVLWAQVQPSLASDFTPPTTIVDLCSLQPHPITCFDYILTFLVGQSFSLLHRPPPSVAVADMAFNNWDKLRKAQRDYPKPNKVAESFVRKALKKSPQNPFLLVRRVRTLLSARANLYEAWEANLSLQWSCDAETAIDQVQQAWQQPGSNDVRLLSYLYETLAEATRRSRNLNVISSMGDENSKVWQSAAKTLVRKQDREDLWSGLAKVTLREECWEDFRLVQRCCSLYCKWP